jgi:hypothetical protein
MSAFHPFLPLARWLLSPEADAAHIHTSGLH